MCCLRGALGPWTPLSDVCPRVFPALERGEAGRDNSPHLTHRHTTPTLQICQMTGAMAVEAKTTEPPAISVIIIHTLTAHQPGPATLTSSGLSSELRSWCSMCLGLCHSSNWPHPLSSIIPLDSQERLQSVWGPFSVVWCVLSSFLCRLPIDRRCGWRNRVLNRKRYGCRANQSGIHPCNWTILETEFREWMPGQGLLLVNVTLHTSHIAQHSARAWEYLFCLRTKLI